MTVRRNPFRIAAINENRARLLAGQDCGNIDATDVLVCLPGLLETQQSFDPLIETLGKQFRIFTIDLAGRGDSDFLTDPNRYQMSAYLTDLGLFLAHIQGRLTARPAPTNTALFGRNTTSPDPRLHLVGTSMGGLLGLFVARLQPKIFSSLVLNDIACLLPWTGIMGLIAGLGSATKGHSLFGNLKELAETLRVDPSLIRAVQKPDHLDLPHRSTMFGVDFTEVLAGITVPIFLLKAGKSGIIDDQALTKMRECHPDLRVLEVPDAEHPVPYSPAVCESIRQFLTTPVPGPPSSL